MKVVILDARGRIGTKIATAVRSRRHHVLAAFPNAGVDFETGEGLMQALAGADVVIDVTGPPVCHHSSLELVERVCVNVINAASAAHVRHHVALSDLGTEFLDSAYFRAQQARENLIAASVVPHTLLRSTQFFEDIDRIDRYSLAGSIVRVAPACVQPVLSDEVAAALVDLAMSLPRNSTLEMAGPERLRLDEVVRRFLSVTRQACEVVTDTQARYFGAKVKSTDLMVADEETIVGVTRFEEWLSRQCGTSALGPSYARSSSRRVQP